MANGNGAANRAEGVLGLARETADSLGQLTMQHLRLARLELKADLNAMAKQAGIVALLAMVGAVGYGLTVAGVAFLVGSGGRSMGLPFLVVGLAHVVAAAVGIAIAVVRLRQMRPMNTTANEVNRSLAPLIAAATTARTPKPEDGHDRSS